MSHHESAAKGPESRLVDRMVFFSDAVFAIVLTLLILELRPPETPRGDEAALVDGLVEQGRNFFAFAFSFLIIGIFWGAHMRLTRRLVVHDGLVQGLNLAFLFTIAFIPFASALLGQHVGSQTAYMVYAAAMVAASTGQTLLWIAIARDGGRLIGGQVPWQEYGYQLLRCMGVGIAFGVMLAMYLTGHADKAQLAPMALVPFIFLTRLLLARGRDAAKEPKSRKR